MKKLTAPFPWYGGKRRVANLVWQHFGDVPNYVEPFAGTLAVLLGRPTQPRMETVNDLDCYISNFWRALKYDPKGLAKAADWPINEADLHARHKWLLDQAAFRERMHSDAAYYDTKIAGWWVWGLSQWIGDRWGAEASNKKPNLSILGSGVHRRSFVTRGNSGENIKAYFLRLAQRLRAVRVCCGDWTRVVTPDITVRWNNSDTVTGVFLDPPYATTRTIKYNQDVKGLSESVRTWAIANGDNPFFRIALCGHSGEHDMPKGWVVIPWRTTIFEMPGEYATAAQETIPLGVRAWVKERIWFSPHCNVLKRRRLFDIAGERGVKHIVKRRLK